VKALPALAHRHRLKSGRASHLFHPRNSMATFVQVCTNVRALRVLPLIGFGSGSGSGSETEIGTGVETGRSCCSWS
jgi:hypothetical protein